MLKFVLVVALVAVAVYYLMRALDRRGMTPRPPSTPTPPRGPLGPDDDPDFIWGLNKKRRHPGDEPPPS